MTPRFGLNCGAAGHGMWEEAYTALGGGFSGFRAYNPPSSGIPASWPGTAFGKSPAEATFKIISLRPEPNSFVGGSSDSAFAAFAAFPAFLEGANPGDWVCCYHEGEASGMAPTQLKAVQEKAQTLVHTYRPDMKCAQITMAYTARTGAHYPLAQWIQPGMDVQRCDGYKPTTDLTVQKVFTPWLKAVQSVDPHAPIAITETNCEPTDRAKWMRNAWTWAVQHQALAFCPFYFAPGAAPANSGPYEWSDTDPANAELKTIIGAAS